MSPGRTGAIVHVGKTPAPGLPQQQKPGGTPSPQEGSPWCREGLVLFGFNVTHISLVLSGCRTG